MRASKATMIIAVLLMFTGLSVPAYSEGSEGDDRGAPGWRERMESKMQKLFTELNLTDAQKQQLDENRSKNREAAKTIVKSLRETRDEMRKELQKEKLDMEKINQLQAQIKENQAKMTDNRLQGILEVHNILTPDQFKKFSEHIEKQRGHFRSERNGHREGLEDGMKGNSSAGTSD